MREEGSSLSLLFFFIVGFTIVRREDIDHYH
jgi:hypothetical protein